ncbi:MAG: hypothetical protein ABI862_07620 [Ilumatobacteraceae bacterium]
MLHSDYLDLAVGLAVVFFLAGMLVSGLNEGISWMTRVRSKFLWAYLYDLFDTRSDRALPRGRLGIIKLWGNRNDRRPEAGGSMISVPTDNLEAGEWLKRVAYALDPIDAPQLMARSNKTLTAIKSVPPASLAQAFLEVFADVGRQEIARPIRTVLDHSATPEELKSSIDLLTRLLDVESSDLQKEVATFRSKLDEVGDAHDANLDEQRRDAADGLTALAPKPAGRIDQQLRDAWRAAAVAWPEGPNDDQLRVVVDATTRLYPDGFARLRIETAIAKMDPKSPLAPTLKRLWEAAAGQIDAFRGNVESYLDGELKRLSGYYRRSIRVVMFSLAFLVAVLGGIDAISVGRNLWRNPEDRAALVGLADGVASNGVVSNGVVSNGVAGADPNAGSTVEGLVLIQQKCADAHPPDEATIATPEEAAAAYAKVRNCVGDALDHLTGVGVIDHALWMDPAAWWHDWANWRFWLHALGILATALALMLGAPFWFDIIKRATGLRKGLTGDT